MVIARANIPESAHRRHSRQNMISYENDTDSYERDVPYQGGAHHGYHGKRWGGDSGRHHPGEVGSQHGDGWDHDADGGWGGGWSESHSGGDGHDQ